MLTLKNSDNAAVSFSTSGKNIADSLTKEWLLANSRGGYAASTVVGCNTSRYHSLLTGSLTPPVNRIMALSNCLETITLDSGNFELSTFEFDEKIAPQGFNYLKRFYQDIGVHFDYQIGSLELTRSLYLSRDNDTIAVVYDFINVPEPAEFTCRPFVGLRDFHALQKSSTSLRASQLADGLIVSSDSPESCGLFLKSGSMSFEKDEQWWFNFIYRKDKERGQDFAEDLWTPGFFKCRVESPTKVILWASLRESCDEQPLKADLDIKTLCCELEKHQKTITRETKHNTEYDILCLAADKFITKRTVNGKLETTILAGFPWFADWGRDAFISLPGLLLSTGRFSEAKSVLTTFAAAASKGMIPNRFDDYSNTACFNSVDASLWFVNAAFQYLNTTTDSRTFTEYLLPTIRSIMESYQSGTRFGIHADTDGLICAGDSQTQLTWMDAKYNGIAFTPRFGKAVEINSLWYSNLRRLAQLYASWDAGTANHYQSMADKVEKSFCRLFWDETAGHLYDCILPDGTIDASLRPNQIFAVSLPFSPLTAEQQKSVVDTVQSHLLTGFGLRTLSPTDPRYVGIYTGPQQQRDAAYHQGTVWPFLMGPFIESFLKVNDFSKTSKHAAAEFIEPLLRHLVEEGCLGSVSEIFDGDPPHKTRGCTAQAWSVAGLLRAYQLINIDIT